MLSFNRWVGLIGGGLLAATALWARPFSALVYNVENLHDVDGVAVYDEYQPAQYSRTHALIKLRNIASVVAKFEGGRGSDLILFQEIEIDQTPAGAEFDYDAFLARYATTTIDAMLGAGFNAEIGDLPAEALLLKALADAKLTGYHVVAGRDTPTDRRAVKTVIFTRFPVLERHDYPTESARNIVEAKLDVDGHPLYVFNNHWKSGASDAKTEQQRVQNAGVLRQRLDELLKQDPQADILIGGDLNSQYNQKRRYRTLPRTGINDVLGSQGSELSIRGPARDLYNLWFELPPEKRGSDTFKGEWGTLMHLIVSRGLYDLRGVQYVDNSFAVARFPGLNTDVTGMPIRWSVQGATASGFSDHFPIFARFVTVDTAQPGKFMPLSRPSDKEDDSTGEGVKIDLGGAEILKAALAPDQIPADANLRDGTFNGKLFRVAGPAPEGKTLKVEYRGELYEIYAPEKAVYDLLVAQRQTGQRLTFIGELGTYKGRWQFVVKAAEWVGQ